MPGITEGYLARHYQGVRGVRDALNNASINGFSFAITDLGDDGRRGKLQVDTPFGSPNITAKVELSRHGFVLPAEMLEPKPMPIHQQYGFTLPALPVVRLEEAIAEKLARFRRVKLARDLYDLAWFADKPFDEVLARRLWVLKAYCDVVLEHRGEKPVLASQILTGYCENDFNKEDTGQLTGDREIPKWIDATKRRFAYLEDLPEEELQWMSCNPRDEYDVRTELARLGEMTPAQGIKSAG